MKVRDIPVDRAREVLSFGRSAAERRSSDLRISVLVDPSAPRELVQLVRDALVPETPHALVLAEVLDDASAGQTDPSCDAVLVVVGGSDAPASRAVMTASTAGVPCCVIAESSVDAPQATPATEGVGLVCATSREALLEKLGAWIVDSCEKDLAFAANFPFVRGPKVDRLIRACAAENAAVGAVALIPGADMPVMTANQAKLALEIAAVYGEDLTPARAVELAGVVGGGFAWRALARQLLGVVPGLGVILKAGVGYMGTVATGTALRARFEMPALLEGESRS